MWSTWEGYNIQDGIAVSEGDFRSSYRSKLAASSMLHHVRQRDLRHERWITQKTEIVNHAVGKLSAK